MSLRHLYKDLRDLKVYDDVCSDHPYTSYKRTKILSLDTTSLMLTSYRIGNDPKKHGVNGIVELYKDDVLHGFTIYMYNVKVSVNVYKKSIEILEDVSDDMKYKITNIPWEDHDDHIQLAKKIYYQMLNRS